jgi:superfamily II DNA/RNA helicase
MKFEVISISYNVTFDYITLQMITHIINLNAPSYREDYMRRANMIEWAGKNGSYTTYLRVENDRQCFEIVSLLRGTNQHLPCELLNGAQRHEVAQEYQRLRRLELREQRNIARRSNRSRPKPSRTSGFQKNVFLKYTGSRRFRTQPIRSPRKVPLFLEF